MSSVTENLEHLASRLNGSGAAARGLFAGELAAALLWNQDGAKTERLNRQGLPCGAIQASVGGQPAAIFFEYDGQADMLMKDAALFAYHTSIEWGVLTSPASIQVFNSHWVKDSNWFRMPPFGLHQFREQSPVLEAFTPRGLIEGEIDRVATSIQGAPDEELLPVDDALVDRLDQWRSEAIRHSREIHNLDEKLQSLFAQLFVLRAVEDRSLSPELPVLSDTLSPGKVADLAMLQRLFNLAKTHIQSDLFDIPVPDEIPDFIHGGIIYDLYHPHQLPMQAARYNFSWVNADVLGRAYEKYLSTVLIPSRAIDPQLRLFDFPNREVERISRRKASGVYYTPTYIVKYLTEKCLDEYYQDKDISDPATPLPRVADVSCGSGSFLTAALDSMIGRLKKAVDRPDWPKALVDNRSIVGVDIDQRAVTLARLSLWLRLAEEPNPLPLPSLRDSIVCGDSLDDPSWNSLPEQYDVILGNPPFVAIGGVHRRAELAKKYITARGRFDYSYLFVEMSLGRLADGGILGLVVPNRLFRNRDASVLRGEITQRTALLTLVDFGSTEVFTGTSSYVGLIVARKGTGDPGGSRRQFRYILVREMPVRFLGASIFQADRAPGHIRDARISAYSAQQPRGTSAWLALSPTSRQARVRLEGISEPLSEFASVFQGITTGANDLFVVELDTSAAGAVCQVKNGIGDVHWVERTLLRPVIYGSEIQRYDLIDTKKYLLYPYEDGVAIHEAVLSAKYPNAMAYFEAYRTLLEMRSGVADSHKAWYELYRSRSEAWLESRKLLSRDLATEPSFALDDDGSVFIVKGTAIVIQDQEYTEAFLGYLNSKLSAWFLAQVSTAFRSGFQKFEPQHLDKLLVPLILVENKEFRGRISGLVRDVIQAKLTQDAAAQRSLEDEIDAEFFAATGIRADELD